VTKMRRMSVFLILLSSGISILSGRALDRNSSAGMMNFRAVYFGARCLIQHVDPYRESEFLRIYRAEGGQVPSDPSRARLFLRAVPICVNLPTTLFLIAPLALMGWGPAHFLWMALLAASFTLAAFLAMDLAGQYSEGVSLFLICILLANSEVLFTIGNTAGIAISLCVVAVWCFFRERFLPAGVLCLALSLAIKPHDSGLVWLYFLLAGGAYRKRALQTLAVTFVLAVPAVLWVSQNSPQWTNELRANLAETSAHGDISDPGPSSINGRGSADIMINLQTVMSVFRDDPDFFNLSTYFACGSLLLIWAATTLRSSSSPSNTLLALASIAALSMLATYHRPYDAKLLLLAVPACAMLWAEGGLIAQLTLLVTTAGVLLTGDIPLAILAFITRDLDVATMEVPAKVLMVGFLRPAPLILLIIAAFYLWIYVRRARASAKTREHVNRISASVSSA
jgi:Glycosyltransferase family 87